MNKKLILRKAHRYIGLLVSLQLLAWTLGGIWFSWNDIDNIHGDHLKSKPIAHPIAKPLISTQKAIESISDLQRLKSLSIIQVLDNPIYKIEYISSPQSNKTRLINAYTGMTMPEISKDQAIQIAKSHASFKAEVFTTELIKETDNHHEYRKKPMPAWAITFDYPSSPTFYVSTQLGVLTSVRHTSWRIFDFLWMLHTMDYQDRDDFGNWLIKIFSLIALVTALSGIVLFFISRKKKTKKTPH